MHFIIIVRVQMEPATLQANVPTRVEPPLEIVLRGDLKLY